MLWLNGQGILGWVGAFRIRFRDGIWFEPLCNLSSLPFPHLIPFPHLVFLYSDSCLVSLVVLRLYHCFRFFPFSIFNINSIFLKCLSHRGEKTDQHAPLQAEVFRFDYFCVLLIIALGLAQIHILDYLLKGLGSAHECDVRCSRLAWNLCSSRDFFTNALPNWKQKPKFVGIFCTNALHFKEIKQSPSFSKLEQGWEIFLIDGCQFLYASLDNLVSSLPTHKLNAMHQFANHDHQALLSRKWQGSVPVRLCWLLGHAWRN